MSTRKLKIGILGTASIAERMVVPALAELFELYEIVGVGTRTPQQKAEHSFWKQFPIFSYEDLFETAKPDVVYIPLPNGLHQHWIEYSLLRGIHVLVEKSITCTLEDTRSVLELAKEKQLVLMENFQFRFHKQLSVIQDVVAKGRIGQLRSVNILFGFPPFKEEDNIRYSTELGGGALYDCGAYPIKIAQILLGSDIQIAAASLTMDPERNIDLRGGGYIRQNKGDLFASFAFGFDHHYQCKLELWGSEGKLTADRIFTAPPGFEVQLTLETGRGKEWIEVGADNHFINLLNYFHHQVVKGSELETEYRQNLRQAELLTQFKSIAHVS
jgi:predicted dehydrogenase